MSLNSLLQSPSTLIYWRPEIHPGFPELRNESCVGFSSVIQSCLTLCDPMDCRRTGLPVYHQLPGFTQTLDHNKLWEILQEMGMPDQLTCLLRTLYAGQEATVRNGYGKTDWLLGKEYIKAVYCHLVYLTYMQSTSCEMPGWMNHKLESKLLREISTTSDMQMIPL